MSFARCLLVCTLLAGCDLRSPPHPGGATDPTVTTDLGPALDGLEPSAIAGPGWSVMASGTTRSLNAVWGSGPDDVFAVGEAGTILHFDGERWQPMGSGTVEGLTGVWGSAPNSVLASSALRSTTPLRYDGAAWRPVPCPPTGSGFAGVWGSSATDIYAVGGALGQVKCLGPCQGTVLHFDGASWRVVLSVDDERLQAVWGSGPRDVFVAGEQGIYHHDGQAWSAMRRPAGASGVRGIWGSSGSNVFAATATGQILRYDGAEWRVAAATPRPLAGIWGSSADDVLVVGEAGTILRFDGASWSAVNAGVSADLHGVWGSGPTNVFAVGEGGLILRYGW